MEDTTQPACDHPDFDATVNVNRIGEEDEANPNPGYPRAYSVDLAIKCLACGEPFRFVGVPVGVSFYAPMSSFDAQELRAPIVPATQAAQVEGLAGFSVSALVRPGDFLKLEGGTLDIGGCTREQAEAIAAQKRETDPGLTVRWEGEPI